MDSMPSIHPGTHLDIEISKQAHPDHTPTQHVEDIYAKHWELPRGVTETDEEKRKHWYIGSIDCGTTSSRFIIFDGEGNPVTSHQIEFENIYPESG